MCISPKRVFSKGPEGVVSREVACRKCWACRENSLTDLCGRALAEAATARATCALTLTYAPTADSSDRIITPPHVQRFFKRLRRRGHLVRYYVAGEYGGQTARAHFHVILFFHSPPPDWPQKARFWDDVWPHGHLFADWSADDAAVSYVARYMRKDGGWWSLSKKPPIGWPFFYRQAQRMVAENLVPTSFVYRPPGGTRRSGYFMAGATRRDFLLAVSDLYDAAGRPMPQLTDYVADALDSALRWRSMREGSYVSPADQWQQWRSALEAEVVDRNLSYVLRI